MKNIGNSVHIGFCAVVMLVALRVGIGWHFFKEGAGKLNSPSFSSTGFLRGATGPLADFYHGLIPGNQIFDAANGKKTRDDTTKAWELYRERAVKRFSFDKQQTTAAEQAFNRAQAGMRYFFSENAEDIEEYNNEFDRLKKAKLETNLRDVAFRSRWMSEKEAELQGKLTGWQRAVEKLWVGYESDINALASKEQLDAKGHFALPRPKQGLASAETVDKVIPYLTLIVGGCLIVGLFTRLAGVVGAGFLLSVISTQPPWVPGAQDTYNQSVEMIALLFLAAIGAGRFGGLDFIFSRLCSGCCRSKCKE